MKKIYVTEKTRTVLRLLGGSVALIVLLGGYMGQLIQNVTQILTHNTKPFSFNPFYAIKTSFTSIEGVLGMMVMACVAAALSIYYYKRKMFDNEPNDDRNFKISEKGTYGTARLCEPEEIKTKFDIVPSSNMNGLILGMLDPEGQEIICRRDYATGKDIQGNLNVAVFGSAGTGKSRCYIRPAIIQGAAMGESMIITDTKGDLYNDTSIFLREKGYDVKVFNLYDIMCSDAWNCFSCMKEDPVTMCQLLARTVIANTNTNAKGDIFWERAEENLLNAIALLVLLGSDYGKAENEKESEAESSISEEEAAIAEAGKSLGAVYAELTTTKLEDLTKRVGTLPSGHPAHQPYSTFQKATPATQANIIAGLGSRLNVFQNESIRKITQYNEIDLTRPANEKCAYFMILSDQDNTLNFLSSLFFSFIFMQLVREAYNNEENPGVCKQRVNFLFDEFCNIGFIPDFERKISTVRSRNITMMIMCQSLPQLKDRYPHQLWEVILGNCDTQICIGCTDDTTAKFVSERSGDTTTEVASRRVERKTIPVLEVPATFSESVGYGKRKALTHDEVLRKPFNQTIIMSSGINVILCYKFDYTRHPLAQKLIPANYRKHKPDWRRKEQRVVVESKAAKPRVDKRGEPEIATSDRCADEPVVTKDDTREVKKNQPEQQSKPTGTAPAGTTDDDDTPDTAPAGTTDDDDTPDTAPGGTTDDDDTPDAAPAASEDEAPTPENAVSSNPRPVAAQARPKIPDNTQPQKPKTESPETLPPTDDHPGWKRVSGS